MKKVLTELDFLKNPHSNEDADPEINKTTQDVKKQEDWLISLYKFVSRLHKKYLKFIDKHPLWTIFLLTFVLPTYFSLFLLKIVIKTIIRPELLFNFIGNIIKFIGNIIMFILPLIGIILLIALICLLISWFASLAPTTIIIILLVLILFFK